MQAIDINKRLVNGYLELFRNLSANSKLDLIAGLSDSLKVNKKDKANSLSLVIGGFISEKSADEVVDEIKSARKFKRNTESF